MITESTIVLVFLVGLLIVATMAGTYFICKNTTSDVIEAMIKVIDNATTEDDDWNFEDELEEGER